MVRRTTAVTCALAAALSLGGCFDDGASAGRLGPGGSAASWSLLGTADGGHALVVRAGEYGACEKPPKVTVREAADRVTVLATRVERDCGGGSVDAVAYRGQPTTIHLGAPLAGRRIVGAKRTRENRRGVTDERQMEPALRRVGRTLPTTARADLRAQNREASAAPALLGLTLADARDVAYRVEADVVAPHGLSSAGIVAQRPSPGQSIVLTKRRIVVR